MKRDYWVDNVKVVACILVVFGHFFQSMVKSKIIPDSDLYEWFNATIYYFHVPLFFICSGYLYQKYKSINSLKEWVTNIANKAIALGIPYFAFTFVTWFMKTIANNEVNEKVGGLIYRLFSLPIAPYWYLYCLFFLFVITPHFKDAKCCLISLFIAVVLKFLWIKGDLSSICAINLIANNWVWFLLGSIFTFTNTDRMKKRSGYILLLLFVACSVMTYNWDGYYKNYIEFLMGICACTAIVMICFHASHSFPLSKYTMPIFLMHTIFAASFRIILLKVGIINAGAHIICGLGISFIGPILLDNLMEKYKYFDFILYPNRYLRIAEKR